MKYIYTEGRDGQRPEKHSAGFSDAQIYIMRSGWGEHRANGSESCLIAFFAAAATNHDHEDLMSFELYSRGAKWITDLGRYNYNETSEEREYIISAGAHNTIVPYRIVSDSAKDLPPPGGHARSSRNRNIEKKTVLQEVKPPSGMGPDILTWISNAEYDYLEGYMQYSNRMFCHNRAILFIKPSCFLIVDRLVAKEKMHVKQYFHFPPDVSVTDKGDFIYLLESAQGQSCIVKAIKPFSSGKTEIVSGRTKPEYQGWYSGAFNDFVPAAVLENQAAFLGETYVIYLFVPTGQNSPSSFRIAVSDRGFADDSNGAIGQLRLEIDTPQKKIEIKYAPSAKYLDSRAGEGGAPQINIVNERK